MVSKSSQSPRISLTPIQPPKASNQKRKRGRPPGASRVDQDASNSEAPVNNDEPDVEEQARPRKRGRKPNAENIKTAASSAQDGPTQPARRGRSNKTSQQDAAKDTEGLPEGQGKGTGRNPKDVVKKTTSASKGEGEAVQSNESRAEDEQSGSAPRRSGRERRAPDPATTSSGGRKSDERKGQTTSVAEKARPKKRAETSPEEGAASKPQKQGRGAVSGHTGPKRGRPRLGNEDNGERRALQPQQGNRAKVPGKASKQAQQSIATGPEGEGSQPKRRGRPKTSDGPSRASGKDQPSEAQPPVQGRPSRPREDQDGAPPKAKREQAQPRRVESVPDEADGSDPDEEEDEEEPELPFRHLRETTKNIPRSTISEKWNPLDGPSITAVGAFLADAQRPVLLRLQDTNRRREHASSALSVVSRRLRSKLVKGFPFPAPTAGALTRAGSGSYEDEFNFERTVDATQALENTLNPLQHSVALLEREIKREEDALAKDYDYLHKLEANARSAAKKWREQAKREHVLAPGVKRNGEGGGVEESKDSLELVPRSEGDASGGLFRDLEDEELVTISKQIGSHMESMKGNLQQIGGVVPAIVKGKAALQQVLLKHLDDEQYERVLVG